MFFLESMRIEELDYFLPKDLIAQEPERQRASARLLVLNRLDGSIRHRRFNDVTECLREGDLLVVNDTRVIPARLPARKATGGRVDILLTEEVDRVRWNCLVTGVGRGFDETRVWVGGAEVRLIRGKPFWTLETTERMDVERLMSDFGVMPLPPYIKRKGSRRNCDDNERYQTVYARYPGSIAAPTAGLHFDEDLFGRIRMMGVDIVYITLHIGIGTFFLLKGENVEGHVMHREYYSMSDASMEAVRLARQRGHRVVAVGTSAVRTLETAFSGSNGGRPAGFTELYIYPGYRYRVVDGLITNFHLPRSTPLVLVSAFAGTEALMRAYREAVEQRYRFYSYGDAMFVS